MARMARVVVPEVPYHVTHRGNRRGNIYLCEQDRDGYLGLLSRYAAEHQLEIWGWCLMSNHVHLLAYPHAEIRGRLTQIAAEVRIFGCFSSP